MEPLSMVVGFAGLAGLFSTCVDCFKLVQVWDSRSSDYGVLQTMLDNQQFHFMAWGKACGFMDPYRTNSRFDDPTSCIRNQRIEQTMDKIKSLLTNGDNLKEMYGLKVQRAPLGSKFIEATLSSAFSRAFQSTKAFCNTSLQRKVQIVGSIRWAVSDRDKFDRLVQNLRDLLGDLVKLTEDIGVTNSQHLVVEYEIEMIDDELSLEAITAASACDDNDEILSHAASRRLKMVQEQSVANQSVRFDDSVSMVPAQHYTPSMSTLIEDEDNTITPEIGVTRVPLSEWRKMKTRTGIIPWLKILIVATSSSTDSLEMRDNIQPLSRANTLDGKEPATCESLLRVAINSHTLLSILKRKTACNLTPKHNVLVYPFKPITLYYDSLRNYLTAMGDKLDIQCGPHGPQAPEVASESISNQPGPAPENEGNEHSEAERLQARRAFEELQCLMDFIDSDMQELLNLRYQIRENKLQKILFEHLWLLFQPGVIVISPNTRFKLRAYQVLHVTGGRRIIDIDNHSKSEGLDNTDNMNYDIQEGYAVISSRQRSDLVVDCFYMDFNGEMYGPRPQRFVISEFVGERDIISLPIYPPNKAQADEGILQRLQERGRKFVHCAAGRRHIYNGATLQEWDPGHRDTCGFCARKYFVQEQRNSEVIIDHMAALEHCRNSGCIWNPSFGGGVIARATGADKREAFESIDCSKPNCRTCTDVFDDAEVDLISRDQFIRSSRSLRAIQQNELDDQQILLLPNRVCGYSLQSHKWYPLHVDLLISIEKPSASLDEIILPDGYKEMLTSLIRGQSPGVSRTGDQLSPDLDMVVGRGHGVVILLHGSSGTGKTTTAEALAASLSRPLFLIKIAALRGTSREMEQYLTQSFHLAERWNCILLVREADALLQPRTKTDHEGNTMTSIFLDVLEYFSGILIFTTNRVGTLDEAITSRIHLSLHYPRLDTTGTIKLWKLNLRRLKHNPNFKVHERDILELAREMHGRLRWNGRQITNIVDTAIALAHEEAKQSHETAELSRRHIEVVFKSSQEFRDYLTTIHRETEEQQHARTRMDMSEPDIRSTSSLSRKYKVRPGVRSDWQSPTGSFAGDDRSIRNGFRPNDEDSSSDPEIKIKELELRLQISKLKKRQKALKSATNTLRGHHRFSEASQGLTSNTDSSA
ncbi:hypothetical protein ACJ72_07246 [Emergomyces africanus]|uniref:AAA+ ATPase domain-containing protein n=1 Tax=Emergomyces africanus TaxID=1955775 RepID=A0A1B7NP83_9EURO|nr:hypothetical protein ACJ72_07246 [Emergomyces africanus]